MPSAFPILNQSPHPHEHFSATRELERKLRAVVEGEVRFDDTSRALYATDSSNYRQVPIGVVVPRSERDVIEAIAVCRSMGAPVLSRGGGTSLAGQTCNSAVVFDFSKYMRRLRSLDAEDRCAVVEPGIVLDRVREAAEQHNLTFAPDPATHNRCTLGGMIGNNSCGTHALMGGKTVDNIRSLDVLLYDGTRLRVGRTSDQEYEEIVGRGGRAADLYQGLRRLRDRYADEIRRKFPRIPRRVSGYNLDELLPENGFNIARALVGSEGTLVTVLSAELDLMHSPRCRRLVVVTFPDACLAADAVPAILEYKPIGLEGLDQTLLDGMARKHLAQDEVKMLPEGGAYLLVEFGADDNQQADDQAQSFCEQTAQIPNVQHAKIFDGEDAEKIWRVRESGLGATVFVPGQPHHWEGWEDAALPPARLGEYFRKLFVLMDEFDYSSPVYGHFGQGCVHMRINFDLTSEPGIRRYREFIDRAADLVVSLGGSLSGEHGDGQSRGALLPKMFGPEIMQAFREFKRLWDPENKMNPGKLISPDNDVYEPTQNLRLGDGYESARPKTYFQFPQDGGSFGEAALRCVGVGACRKQESGTMCPSYMATHEEQHSTRGRAHLLWEMLQKDVIDTQWESEGVKEALDLCLSCKACRSECPVAVDMATYKAEFLAHYYEKKPRKAQHYAFGFMDRWARLASQAPGLSQRLANLSMPLASPAMKQMLDVAPQRRLPRFAPRSFQQQWRGSGSDGGAASVLLWPDTWNNYYHPKSLLAGAEVLERAGFQVEVPQQHVCCGRPLYDFGFLKHARAYLTRILRRFASQIDRGTPFIFLEPSCASVFCNELLEFFPHDERAKRLSQQTMLLSQFLTRKAPHFKPARHEGTRIVLHGHCHHKAVFGMEDEVAWLERTGAKVDLLNSGCCGMAGPFGFEKEKFEVSQILGNRVLLPAVRMAGLRDLIVTDGFSCREQITQNTVREPIHFAQAICPTK